MQLGEGAPVPAPDLQGVIAGGEPEAVLAATGLLRAHGNAIDAGAALGLALAVTLPSRAGLGAAGRCVVRDAEGIVVGTEIVDAQPLRFAAGMFALHARYGDRPWAQVVAPAERLARFGTPVSRALADDIRAAGARLIDARALFARFSTPERQLMTVGATLIQPDLAATLATLRTAPVTADAPPVPLTIAPLKAQAVEGLSVFRFAGTGEEHSGTGFVVGDSAGRVMACALGLGALFGDTVQGRGGVLAARPDLDLPEIALVMARDTTEPRAAVYGATPDLAAFLRGLAKTRRFDPRTAGAKGWVCPTGLQSDGQRCDAFVPRGSPDYAVMVLPEKN